MEQKPIKNYNHQRSNTNEEEGEHEGCGSSAKVFWNKNHKQIPKSLNLIESKWTRRVARTRTTSPSEAAAAEEEDKDDKEGYKKSGITVRKFANGFWPV